MRMPIFEVLDRFTIWKLKHERIGGKECTEAFIFHLNEALRIERKYPKIKILIDKLYQYNSEIWDLEADLRAGKEGKMTLEETGKRAIQIRDINKARISIKSQIIDMTGDGFKDIKINHCSGE